MRLLPLIGLCIATSSAIVHERDASINVSAPSPMSSPPNRQPRSIFSLFFDGFRNIHDKLHDNQDKEKTEHEEEDAVNEEEKNGAESDLPVVIKSGCKTKFVTVESVHYTESVTRECVTRNVSQCREEPYEKCRDVVREVCREAEGQECYDKYDENCETKYREEVSHSQERQCDQECQYKWEGEGNDKRWVVDTDTCSCGHVTRETRVKVPYYDCQLVKRKECRSVPVTKCRKVPDRECQIGKRKVCEDKPETECDDIHRKVPHTLKRKKPVEVCDSDSENKYVIDV